MNENESSTDKQPENLGIQFLRAVYADDLNVAETCLAIDPACVNAQDAYSGVTGLHIAIVRQNVAMVSLIANHPDFDIWKRDHMDRAPTDMLRYTSNSDIFEVLMLKAYPEDYEMWKQPNDLCPEAKLLPPNL